MARGEGDGLVQKEELRVCTGAHQRTPATLELQAADQPHHVARRPDDFFVVVVQNAAVAHERATGGSGNEFPAWSDPVLQRHAVTVSSSSDIRGVFCTCDR